jgi:hypothetical protein
MGRDEHPIAVVLGYAAAGLALLAVWSTVARADWGSAPVVPRLNAPTKKALISTLRRGVKLGNRPNVFSKIGDSISQSPAFLQGLGCGQWRLGRYSGLRPEIAYFARRGLPGRSSECGARANSFSRNSAATLFFRTSSWPLSTGDTPDPLCGPGETPLDCEFRLDKPAFALILLGTNDVTVGHANNGDPLASFTANIDRIVSTARSLGVAPILSTIPPRTDSAVAEASTEELNAGLWRLAATRHVPLINLWRALNPLPNHGITPDFLHLTVSGSPGCPSPCDPNGCVPSCRAANFTTAGLQYGSNVRNLITLQTLRRLSRAVPGRR